MDVDYDPPKRDATLAERGLDMRDTAELWDGPHLTFEDDREDYGEIRQVTLGLLKDRMVFVVWTQRDPIRWIISMRKANARECARYGPRLEGDDAGEEPGGGTP